MNKDVLQGNWQEAKAKIRQQWTSITDEDVKTMKGTYDELCKTLQKRYGFDKPKAEKEVNEFLKKYKYN